VRFASAVFTACAAIHDHLSIASEVAERLSHICQANAKMHGGSATIVILDPYGRLVHEHRMDGQSYINQKAAEKKAMTALLTREPSHVLTNRAFDDVSTLIRMDQFGLNVQEGGLPIIVNDQLIGAIGVGGDQFKHFPLDVSGAATHKCYPSASARWGKHLIRCYPSPARRQGKHFRSKCKFACWKHLLQRAAMNFAALAKAEGAAAA
jgi:uncharacterized protein GlcG (DUF336 family)